MPGFSTCWVEALPLSPCHATRAKPSRSVAWRCFCIHTSLGTHGKHQQSGIVLPAAPAEFGYHRQDFGLQLVGGQRALILQQTQQARFAKLLSSAVRSFRDTVGKQNHSIAGG